MSLKFVDKMRRRGVRMKSQKPRKQNFAQKWRTRSGRSLHEFVLIEETDRCGD